MRDRDSRKKKKKKIYYEQTKRSEIHDNEKHDDKLI